MSVKSYIIPASNYTGWHYPALGYSDPLNGTFIIVLFSKHGHGTVVYAANERGTQVGGWMSAWDMKCFRPWHGTVQLSIEAFDNAADRQQGGPDGDRQDHHPI